MMNVYTMAQRQLTAAPATVLTTREEWLVGAVTMLDDLINPDIQRNAYRVSVGFPVGKRGGSKSGKVIGQCHYAASDGVPQIFIHPEMTDPIQVLHVLLHERIHGMLPVGTGHGKLFASVCRDAGLVGPWTATTPGEGLIPVLEAIADALGEYPHAALDWADARGRKQGTRMIRCECMECGFLFRTTNAWLSQVEDLQCPDPGCGGQVLVG